MRILVLDRQRGLRVSKKALRTIARAALAVEEPRSGNDTGGVSGGVSGRRTATAGYDEIGINLVTDDLMRELNRTYRGLDRSTDVLSFDLRGARAAREPHAGEILISTDRVLAQARRYRGTPARELARVLIHGLLHLQGFDHRKMAERRRMRAVERRLMAAVAPAIAGLTTGVR